MQHQDHTTTPKLSALYRYPLKSCRGQALQTARVDRYGIEGDRRWMLTTTGGKFLSQRQLPRMALIQATPCGSGIRLSAPGAAPLLVAMPAAGKPGAATVWDDSVMVVDAGEAAAGWASRFLDTSCRIVGMATQYRRGVDPDYANDGDQVSLADGFPFLLISEGSLQALNARLPKPLPMERFRPNLVVSGCDAFAEDSWKRVRIGDLVFRVAKPCSRCAITTTDQQIGQRDGPEPLRTLLRFHQVGAGNKAWFGQNLVHENSAGELKVGDRLEVLE